MVGLVADAWTVDGLAVASMGAVLVGSLLGLAGGTEARTSAFTSLSSPSVSGNKYKPFISSDQRLFTSNRLCGTSSVNDPRQIVRKNEAFLRREADRECGGLISLEEG